MGSGTSCSVLIAIGLLFGNTALSEEVGSAEAASATSAHGYVTPSQRGDQAGVDELLMGLLGAAALAFHLRRKYKASERAWQRILTSEELVTPIAEPLPPRSLTMRWQQIP